jgi:hypothetical protein
VVKPLKNVFVRRIDFEPKGDFLGFRTYAHVFLRNERDEEVDVYTDDPRLEAALLAAYDPFAPQPPKVEVHYEEIENVKKIVRVILDREFNKRPGVPRPA